MSKLAALAALVALIPLVSAQSGLYQQCGGIGFTGSTSCVSGSSCTYLNDYYSQCLPGATTAAPPTTTVSSSRTGPTSSPTGSSSAPSSTSTPDAGNPFVGYTMYVNPYYTNEVQLAVANITDATTKAKAASVANIPSFVWLDQVAKVPSLGTYLADASAQQTSSGKKLIVPIVVYDLPNRDCAAAASDGEFTIANNGVANYENYIDQIVAQVKRKCMSISLGVYIHTPTEYPDVRVVAVIEPDSLANLVTNLSVAACSAAQSAYETCVTYAMQQLNSVGVYMYLDAGHAGWLGWPANLSPAAQLFSQLYTSAGKPAFVRGLATNVANYNALSASTPDPITQGNPNYDELLYINALSPLLTSGGFPAHFVVEQARSGVQNIRQAWGDWCNVKGAGFGIQPTTNTGSSLIDSIVWVKPGGESDGTTNTSSPRYDYHCALSDATSPAPEAGTWFQNYFVTLVTAANPPL